MMRDSRKSEQITSSEPWKTQTTPTGTTQKGTEITATEGAVDFPSTFDFGSWNDDPVAEAL